MNDEDGEQSASRSLHPVVAILIGWSWIRLLLFVAILVWLIVDGTTLARAIGGVLLALIAVWIWRSFRPN